jgi:hypothetical protein
MDRVTGFYPVGWGFESLQARKQLLIVGVKTPKVVAI